MRPACGGGVATAAGSIPPGARGPHRRPRRCCRSFGRAARRGAAGCSISRRISACPALRRSPARRTASVLPLAWRRGRHSRPRPALPFWKCVRANWPMRWSKPRPGSAAKPRSTHGTAIHRRRATMLNADQCLLLQPVPERATACRPSTRPIRAPCCELIVDRLEQLGIETFGLDLTRPRFAVPVARVIAPGLQPSLPRLLRHGWRI